MDQWDSFTVGCDRVTVFTGLQVCVISQRCQFMDFVHVIFKISGRHKLDSLIPCVEASIGIKFFSALALMLMLRLYLELKRSRLYIDLIISI